MRYLGYAGTAMMLLAAQLCRAQSIPATVAQAEAEGATFPHAAPPAVVQFMFNGPFAGTAARRCARSLPDDSIPGGSLRSGDFIIRGHMTGPWGLRAGGESKILWMPLHGPADSSAMLSFAEWREKATEHAPLLIRAVRVGAPADTLRLTRAGLSGDARQFGFPSTVIFPRGGDWLVIATSGEDWGCFVLTVAP